MPTGQNKGRMEKRLTPETKVPSESSLPGQPKKLTAKTKVPSESSLPGKIGQLQALNTKKHKIPIMDTLRGAVLVYQINKEHSLSRTKSTPNMRKLIQVEPTKKAAESSV